MVGKAREIARDEQSRLMRISSCLQTILDLEPKLEKLDLGKSLIKEFVVLKSFLKKIDTIDLSEDDVSRIEKATASFLEELRGPLSAMEKQAVKSSMLQ